MRPPVERITYGADPSQVAWLHRPAGASRGVVGVIHGGFWKAAYGAELGDPLARDLATAGWTAWNVEYRRVGNGGGFPETLDDVHAALDRLADLDLDLDLRRVVTLGHSAGGHLATWSAARGRLERWSPTRVAVTHVVSQAGVVDLTAAHADDLGSGAAAALMGGGPGDPAYAERYDQADPSRHLPLDVPVWCVHARDDDIVPFSQSERYVAQARAAGAEATLVEVPDGHFGVVDTDSSAWARIKALLDDL